MKTVKKRSLKLNNKVKINYTNYKGVTKDRIIIPKEIIFEENEWHNEKQWILVAFDIEKDDYRNFALKDIHSWLPIIDK